MKIPKGKLKQEQSESEPKKEEIKTQVKDHERFAVDQE